MATTSKKWKDVPRTIKENVTSQPGNKLNFFNTHQINYPPYQGNRLAVSNQFSYLKMVQLIQIKTISFIKNKKHVTK